MKHGAILNYNCYRILNTTKVELRIIGRFIKDNTNYNLCFLHRTNTTQCLYAASASKNSFNAKRTPSVRFVTQKEIVLFFWV